MSRLSQLRQRFNFTRLAVSSGVIGGTFVTIAVLAGSAPKATVDEEAAFLPNVVAEEGAYCEIVPSVWTTGVVAARDRSNIQAEIAGRVTEISNDFIAGRLLHRGDVITRIDPRDYHVAVEQARVKVAAAREKLEREEALAQVAVWERERAGDVTKAPTLALRELAVQQAQTELRGALADLAATEVRLDRTEIRMPYDGRVVERSIGRGSYVSPGTRIGEIYAVDTLHVRLPVSITDVHRLGWELSTDGFDDARNRGIAYLTAQSSQEDPLIGRIVSVSSTVNDATGLTFAIAEVVGDAAKDLSVGAFLIATVVSDGGEREVMVLPRDALRDESFVYVVSSENIVDVRPVTPVQTWQDWFAVAPGFLKDGERALVSFVGELIAGGEVNVVDRETTLEAAALAQSHPCGSDASFASATEITK